MTDCREETVRISLPSVQKTLSFTALVWEQNKFLAAGRQTGHAIWPCTQLLIDYLSNRAAASLLPSSPSSASPASPLTLFSDLRVLELGCGLGACGCAAAALGARRVTLSDGDPVIVERAEASALANGLDMLIGRNISVESSQEVSYAADMPTCDSDSGVDSTLLRWDDTSTDEYARRSPSTRARYATPDLIIASDVLYGPDVAVVANLLRLVVSLMTPLAAPLLAPCRVGTEHSDAIASLAAPAPVPSREPSPCRFVLAFENRGDLALCAIVDAAAALGLACRVPNHGDGGEWYEDIFANRTLEMTDFWGRCLLEFTLMPPLLSESLSVTTAAVGTAGEAHAVAT
jgi:ribosomal protein L11 methylase PrmA